MKLKQWLDATQKTDIEFSAETGLNPSTISRIKREIQRPDWETMMNILGATDGCVAPNDYLPDEYREILTRSPRIKPARKARGGRK